MKHILMIFLFALSSSLFSSAQAGVEIPTKQELRVGIVQEFDTLNQLISTMLASQYIYYAVGRPLAILDPQGQWQAQLATKIPSLENGLAKRMTEGGKKKIQATWQIQKQAKWSDGQPVVCADFALSLEVANNENVGVSARDDYTLVEKITWTDQAPQSCLFTYSEDRWDFFQLGRFFPLPSHIERAVFDKSKTEKQGYDKNTTYAKNPTQPGLYNGPYQVTEVSPGSHVVLTPNPHFFGQKPYFNKVVIKVIPNTGTLEANLLSGGIHMVGPIGFSLDQGLDFDARTKSKGLALKTLYKPSLSYEHIDLDLDVPALQSKQVRQALLYGMDRKKMIEAFFGGQQPIAHHPVTPLDPWYPKNNKQVKVYEYDRKKASELLDQAGWKLNAEDGYRYKNKEKLSLRLMTTSGNKSRETVQAFLQSQWKDIGVDVTIKNEPARVLFGETMKKRLHDGLSMYAWTVLPERSMRPFLHSASIPTEKNGWSGRNVMGWTNKKADRAMDKIDSEFNPNARKKWALEILKAYTEDVPVLPLFYRTDVAVAPAGLKNFNLTGHIHLETNQIETWTME